MLLSKVLQFLCLIFILQQRVVALPAGFVYLKEFDPTIIISPRYFSNENFIGKVVNGYLAPQVVLSIEAASAIHEAQNMLRGLGYAIVAYDGYRPQKAVDDFVRFVNAPEEYKTKPRYYPYITKQEIVEKGYMATKSGHTRGSTIDLSIIKNGDQIHPIQFKFFQLNDGRTIPILDDGTVPMCGSFDLLDLASHHDSTLISQECLERRNMLRDVMKKSGFRILQQEWWHYYLINEPYPDTYFNFDIQ